MKAGIIYNGSFVDQQFVSGTDVTPDQRDHTILIYDNGTLIEDSELEQTIYLEMAGIPLKSQTVNNDEDKFKPILPTAVTINVYTSDQINLNTFCDGEDGRFYLVWYVAGQIYFKGYLLQDDIQQNFQPDPNELKLTFTDRLGLLKEKSLVDADNEYPTGYNRVIDYLTWALRQTGMSLPLNVIMNVREQHTAPFVTNDATFTSGTSTIGVPLNNFFTPGKQFTVEGSVSNDGTYTVIGVGSFFVGFQLVTVTPGLTTEPDGATVTFQDTNPHLYDSIYLEAQTFEGDEPEQAEDCYTVLTKILGESCNLFQQWGEWWIVNVDERDDQFYRVAHFNSAGTFTGFTTDANYYKEIGVDEEIQIINEDPIVRAQRPHKSIKLTYEYEVPEYPCNADFSRGTTRPESPSDDSQDIIDPICWTARKGVPGAYLSEGIDFYTRVTYTDDYEQERYLVITPEAVHEGTSTRQTYVESEPIEITERDKFTVSVDWRLESSGFGGPSNTNFMKVYLRGDDGSDWLLGHETITDSTTPYKWWNTSNFTVNTSAGNENAPNWSLITETEWQSQDFEAPPCPVSGSVRIWLHQFNQTAASDDDRTIHYANLQFDYRPYINGNYRRYQGHYMKISQAGDYSAKRENTVYMSDSPRKIFKGAMFRRENDSYYLVDKFYKSHLIVPPLMPADSDFKRFIEWQAWAVWNQYRLNTRQFELSAQGLDTNSMYSGITVNPVSLLHKYYLTDTDLNTNTRQFQLLHYEADWHLGEWTAYLAEVMNFTTGKDYTATREFKFLSE